MVNARLISVGSRFDGRDFGILGRFTDHGLGRDAVALIEDFSRALLNWGQQIPDDAFSIYFPLAPASQQFLLARVAYRGRAALGPDVLANAIVLGSDELSQSEGYGHRWLGLIADPRSGPWSRTRLATDAMLEQLKPLEWPHLAEIGATLHFYRLPFLCGVATAEPERAIAEVLEAAVGLGRDAGWCTAPSLGRKEGFDPASLSLVMFPSTSKASASSEYPILGKTGWTGSPPPASPMADIRKLLFFKAEKGTRNEQAKAIHHRALTARLSDGNTDLMVRNAILDALHGQALAETALQSLFGEWARLAAALPDASRRDAGLGIAGAYMILITREQDAETKARWLHWFVETLESQIEGVRGLASRVAERENLLLYLNGQDLGHLIGGGLYPSGRGIVEELVRTERFQSGQIDGVVHSLGDVIDRDGTPDAMADGVGMVRALLDIQEEEPPRERRIETLDTAMRFGKNLLDAADSAAAKELGGLLARALRLSVARPSETRVKIKSDLHKRAFGTTASLRPGSHASRYLTLMVERCGENG